MSRFFFCFFLRVFVQTGPQLSKGSRGHIHLPRRLEGFYMFFVKATLAPGVCVRVEVRSDNVFTRCHCCGDEMQVNLTEVFADGKGTLEDTDVLCKDCTDMLMERMRDS